MQKITPFLWFDGNAEEAMKFYVSIFKNSKVLRVRRRDDEGANPNGPVFSVEFELEGLEFIGLNGGPHFKFTPAISFFVDCKTQEEIDDLWERLSEGGEKSQCGWLTDKFGVSWQIIPETLGQLMNDPDAEKSERVFDAMMKMTKIDIEELRKAYEGVPA